MNSTPKVSICIPAYEYPELLERCLISVINQSYDNVEIIITDDSKHDLLKQVVININDSRILYIKNETSLGSPANWNESIKHATGDLLMTLHHDDWFIDNTTIEKFVAAFVANTGVSFAFCQHYINYGSSKRIKHSPQVKFVNDLQKDPSRLLFLNEIGPPSVIMFTKEVSTLLFDVNSKWYVDVIFYVQAIQKFKHIHYIQEPLVNITAGSDKQVTNSTKGAIKVKEAIYTFLKFELLTHQQLPYILQLNLLELLKRYKIQSMQDLKSMGFDNSITDKIKTAFHLSRLPIHYKFYALLRHLTLKYSPF